MTAPRSLAQRWAEPLALFLGSRIAVFGALWTVSRILPVSTARLLWTWDGEWYLELIQHGYPDHVPMVDGKATTSTIAFFPMFPAIARAVHEATGVSALYSAMFVVTVSAAIASVLLFELTAKLYDDDTARRAVALFCLFPGSLALSLVYAEATMLALVIGALLALAHRRFVLAGIVGALAAASRPNAIAFVAAAAVYALSLFRKEDADRWKALATPALSAAGIIAFFGYLWARTGEIDAWFQVERYGWGDYFSPGARIDEVREWISAPGFETAHTVLLVSTIFLLVAVALALRFRLPATLGVYTSTVLVLALGSHEIGARPRFLLVAFPLFIVVARAIRRPVYLTAVAAASGGLLAAYSALITAGRFATP